MSHGGRGGGGALPFTYKTLRIYSILLKERFYGSPQVARQVRAPLPQPAFFSAMP